MRIGFDARFINDRYHGIGRYAFEMLVALTRLAHDHSFVIFLGKGQDSRFDWGTLKRQPNVEVHMGPWPLYWPHEQFIWPFLIRRSNIDVFHSPYFIAPLLANGKLPIIITIHDLIFDRYPQYMPQSWGFSYYRLLMRLGTRRACKVLAVSYSTARDLNSYYAVPYHKIAIIPDGIDLEKWSRLSPSDLQSVRQKYQFSTPFILSVGARRPHKNYRRLVEAFYRICHQLPHELVFAGPSDNRFNDDAKQAAAQYNLNGRVRFLDWVPEKDLPALYQLADIVAQPSLIEGFGLPVLEAMASNTAVLVANNSSLGEVVGKAGIQVDPFNVDQIASTLLSILQNDQACRQLAQAGLQRVMEFNWNDIAKKIIQIYEEATI